MGSKLRNTKTELTHADVRFPHEEISGDVVVAGKEVLTGGTTRAGKKYHYGVEIYDVVIKSLESHHYH